MNTTTLILVAGGKGVRMGAALPKQFLPLNGKPIIHYAAKNFLDTFPGIRIILVLPPDQLSYGNLFLQSFEEIPDITIVAGGATRFHSVQNGLNAATSEGIIFIHDGVRPFTDADLIRRCYDGALKYGSAIPVVPVTDSIRIITETGSRAIDREMLRAIQTPQTFKAEIIKKAYNQEYQEHFTDEATVSEASGSQVHLVEGLRRNIKITTPEDLLIAEALFKN